MTTRTLCTLAALAASLLPACSSSQKRDQWHDTDAGMGYVQTDTALRADLAPDAVDAPSDLTDAVADENPADGSDGSSVESSIDSSDGEGG
jgi:hypothetical protein